MINRLFFWYRTDERHYAPGNQTTALLSASLFLASVFAAPNVSGLLGGLLSSVVVAIMLFDLRSFTIPDWLNGSAFCLGLIYAATQGADAPLQAVMLAVGRGLVSAATLFVVRAAYLRARGRQGIGLGDVKLAAVAGAWLDWSLIPIALEIAAFAALAIYAVRHLIFRAAMSATTRIPFGAFFAPAIWLCWLTEQIMH